MEIEKRPRKQVSSDQLKVLIDFLKQRPELAKGLMRGRKGNLHHTLKLWKLCAKTLNLIKDGAVKDGKGWSKYWCDWKYRVRRRTLELKVAKESNRPPPDGVTPLSPLEEDILAIIGETSVEDDVVVKSDPLADGDTDEEQENNDVLVNQEANSHTMSTRARKRRRSSIDVLGVVERNDDSSDRKTKVSNRNNISDADNDDEVSEFLRLEQEKLDEYKKINGSLQALTSTMRHLTEIMADIKDILSNRAT